MPFFCRYLTGLLNILFVGYLAVCGWMLWSTYELGDGTGLAAVALFCVGSVIRFFAALLIGLLGLACNAVTKTPPKK